MKPPKLYPAERLQPPPPPLSATVVAFGVKIQRRQRGWLKTTLRATYFLRLSTGHELTDSGSSAVAAAVFHLFKLCPFAETNSPLVDKMRNSVFEGDWVLESDAGGRCTIEFSNDVTAPQREPINPHHAIPLIERASKHIDAV